MAGADDLEDDLRRAIAARDEFLCVAAHELLTPVTAVRLQLEALLRGLGRRPEEANCAGRVERHARAALGQLQQLTHLVDEMLDVARIMSGQLSLCRAPVDLADLARAAAARFAPVLAEAGCHLDIEAAGPVVGRWDPARLEQVLGKLLTNAARYGAGHPVALTVDGDAHLAWLRVRDQGIGISATDQERIFDRFERAVSVHQYGGLGLGLWITRQIVEAHGGTVAVESAPGAGATFTVALPREWSDLGVSR